MRLKRRPTGDGEALGTVRADDCAPARLAAVGPAEAAKLANVEAAIPVELTIDCHSRVARPPQSIRITPCSAAPTNAMPWTLITPSSLGNVGHDLAQNERS